jgi:hypothetical protein
VSDQAGASEGSEGFDPSADRYPDIRDVVDKVLDDPDFPSGDVDRIEVTALATGEATWRVWPARAEEPVGGVYTLD